MLKRQQQQQMPRYILAGNEDVEEIFFSPSTLRNYYPNSVLLAAENIFIYFTQRPRFRDVYSVYSVYRVSRESRAGRAAVSWPSQTAVSHASTIS